MLIVRFMDKNYSLSLFYFQSLKRGAALPPSPKGLGFRAVIYG